MIHLLNHKEIQKNTNGQSNKNVVSKLYLIRIFIFFIQLIRHAFEFDETW